MDNQPSSISVPEGVAVTSPAPTMAMPATTPIAAAPTATPPANMPASGESSSDSINDFFKSINWMEAGFAILAALGLYYTIYYYRYRIKEGKVANSDMQRQLDELKMNVQGAMKGKYQSL